jgi:hypothetical protein
MPSNSGYANSTEKRVFQLLKNKKIPELSTGYYFEGDCPDKDVACLSRPDVVYFKQTDDHEVTLYPYDIKECAFGIKPKQLSPYTLELLVQKESFSKRMMENLEEHGMQAMNRRFSDGKAIIEHLYNKYILDKNGQLAYTIQKTKRSGLERNISEFIKRNGIYTVDTYLMRVPNRIKSSNLREYVKRVVEIDPVREKAKGNISMIYSASQTFGQRIRSYEILMEFNDTSRLIRVCPYIKVPK